MKTRLITGPADAETVYLSTADLAARWRVTKNALDVLRSRDVGPRYRKLIHGKGGGMVLYPLDEVLQYEATRLYT